MKVKRKNVDEFGCLDWSSKSRRTRAKAKIEFNFITKLLLVIALAASIRICLSIIGI